LREIDKRWREHLTAMQALRDSVSMHGYAQKDPKQEYKKEGFAMFSDMLERIKHEVIGVLSKVQVRAEADVEAVEQQRRSQSQVKYQHDQASAMGEAPESADAEAKKPLPFTREGRKIGRNEPCPCGSGKKYKQCHGKLT
jgi:preprotein translocase subunit SecA